MNIGFDLDKIFINYPSYISDRIVDKLYKQKKKDNNLFYRVPSKTEQILRLATHTKGFRKPMRENLSFLERLSKDKKNKHYLITGRFGFLKKKTDTFIKRYNFDKIFDGMYFNYENEQPHYFKNTIIKYLKLDKFVDDDLDLLKYVSQENQKTTFFWLNRKIHGMVKKNIVGITKLEQIFDTHTVSQ